MLVILVKRKYSCTWLPKCYFCWIFLSKSFELHVNLWYSTITLKRVKWLQMIFARNEQDFHRDVAQAALFARNILPPNTCQACPHPSSSLCCSNMTFQRLYPHSLAWNGILLPPPITLTPMHLAVSLPHRNVRATRAGLGHFRSSHSPRA